MDILKFVLSDDSFLFISMALLISILFLLIILYFVNDRDSGF